MTRFRVFALFALAAGLLLAAGDSAAQLRTQPKVVVRPGQPAPGQHIIVGGELPLVPKSSAAFVSVKVSALVDHPDLKPVLEKLKTTPDALEGVMETFGVAPHEIDRVTLFWPALSGNRWIGDPVLVVSTREPYNEARLLKSLNAEPVFNDGPGGRGRRGGHGHDGVKSSGPESIRIPPTAKSADPLPPPLKIEPPSKPPPEDDACSATATAVLAGDPLFYELQHGPFSLLFLIDDRTLVFLPEVVGETMHLALLGQLLQKKSTGPLAEAISVAGTHTFAAGIHLPPIFRNFERDTPRELAPYAALFPARTGVVTGDLGKSAKLTLTLSFDDAAAARRAGPVLEEGLKTLATKATQAVAEMKDSNRPQEKAFAPVLETIAVGLKSAAVKTVGNAVVATTDVEVGPAAGKAAAELLQSLASQKKVAGRLNNLKQIGLALHNYHDANGKLPTNIYNAKGEAILSWRVHLLPYMEFDNLYKQFKMDEPWDSENNKKLITPMPKVYEVPGRESPKGATYFQGFVSPDRRKQPPKPANMFDGDAWLVEGDKNGRNLAAIPDGTSNTIAVVEARDAVIWSKPDDLPFGEKLPALGEDRADRFAVLMFDGSVRMLPTKLDATTLRALITVNGGEVIPDLEPRRGFPGGGGGAGAGQSVPKEVPDKAPPPPVIKR